MLLLHGSIGAFNLAQLVLAYLVVALLSLHLACDQTMHAIFVFHDLLDLK